MGIFLFVQFNFCYKNNSYFYLALINLPKFKRGHGQTSVILLVIKFLKTISKEFLDRRIVWRPT